MFKKVLVIIAVFLFILLPLSAQMVLDTATLKFGTYKVDNDFLNSKDPNYTMFGGSYNYYLKDFNGADVAFDENDPGKYWGVGADIYYNIVYYFGSNMKTKRFGYNYDTGGSFLRNLGKVATTTDGKIYAIDKRTKTVYYWDKENESYDPERSVGRIFSGPYDICKDSDDNLYILDGPIKHIYRYNLENDNWHIFNSGNDYIDLSQYYNSEWGRLSGIAVNNNGIYVSYNGGVIVRYSLGGEVLQYYWIDTNNLGLRSSYRENASQTWLVSITTGPEGNVYVADSKAGKIHIFSSSLKYVCSWEDDDPERPFEDTVRDITFYPNNSPNFLISYPWGFYAYTKQNTLVAVQISEDYIYPEFVEDEYTGLGIELDMVGRGGYRDIIAEGPEDVRIIDSRRLSENEHFSYTWNGRNITGGIVPYGEYTLSFLLDDHLVKQIPFSVRKAPEISLTIPEDRVVGSSHPAVLFNFDVAPSELSGVSGIYKRTASTVLLDNNLLLLGQIENESTGFNPTNPNLAEMNASFSMTEGAFVSAEIIDDNYNVVSSLFSGQYFDAGDNTLTWNGKDNDSSFVNDGQYKFRLTAEQPEINVSLKETGELFELDTTSPVIDCNISQIDIDGQTVNFSGTDSSIYISNDEDSSIGIKDNLSASVSYNEPVVFSSDIYSGSDLTRTIINEAPLGENEILNFYWDGSDNLGSVVEDGLYSMRVRAEDEYGNVSLKNVKVWIDTNRLDETNPVEMYFPEGDEFRVNTYTENDQSNPAISATEDGFLITWTSE